MMPGRRFEYRLWRNRPGIVGRIQGDKPVAAGTTDWFDLEDGPATVEKMARLIDRYGDGKTGIEGYWLELLDPATGERVTKVEPSDYDLAMLRDGTAVPDGMPRSRASLQEATDEALIGELARRLRER